MLNAAQLVRIDLNLLVLFVAVMEERHVGRAGARLHLTPSAVSHGLKRLRRLLHDPLFLKVPRGVVPTDRALQLHQPAVDILSRASSLIASATPFDPRTARRRFTIGAPDALLSLLSAPLIEHLAAAAPGVEIRCRQVLPEAGGSAPGDVWRTGLAALDGRGLDVAVLPIAETPPGYASRHVFDEDFVVAMRRGHPLSLTADLERYCACLHLLVSASGDEHGVIDAILARTGLSRRVALTVPSFLMALEVVGSTDMVAALPRRLVERHAERFGLESRELPLSPPRPPDAIRVVAANTALADAGIAWLCQTLEVVFRRFGHSAE